MKKSVVSKLFLFFLLTFFTSCFSSIEESDFGNTVDVETVSEAERLAMIAISGDYTVSVSEMETTLEEFIKKSSPNISNASRSVSAEVPYSLNLAKQENISVVLNTLSDSSSRNVINENSKVEIPLYFYEITTNIEKKGVAENSNDATEKSYVQNLAVTTTDRRIGCVLAYIEDCSVEDLYDEYSGSPAAIFYANLPSYINKVSEIWNNELTEDYVDSVRTCIHARSVASDVVTTYKYGYKNWKCISEDENCIIDKRVARCINQRNYKDIVYDKLGFKYNGCGPTAAMQIQMYYRFPETITVDVADEDGVNYLGKSVWSDFSFAQLINTDKQDTSYTNYKMQKAKKEVVSDIQKYIAAHSDLTVEILSDFLKVKIRDKKNESEKEKQIYFDSCYSYRKYLRWQCDKTKYEEYDRYLKKITSQGQSVFDIYSATSGDIDSYNKLAKSYLNQTPTNWYNTYMSICALMYQTVKGMDAYINNDVNAGTFAMFSSLPKYFRSVGYVCDDLCPYDFQKTKKSIANGNPVPIMGQTAAFTDSKGKFHDVVGHFWLLDGYARYYCEYYEKSEDNIIGNMEADYVHVNWGWSGSKNGYYLSNVFDSQYQPLKTSDKDVNSTTRSASNNNNTPEELEKKKDGLYKVGLKILPNLHPNR